MTRYLVHYAALFLLLFSLSVPADDGRLIQHSVGDTRVPAKAQRIVTLSNDATEALLALDIQPVGATRSLSGNPWYPHLAQSMQKVTVVGLENNPDLELIASLKPDLILGSRQQSGQLYNTLSLIAPTVLVKDSRRHWQQNFQLYAKAAGRECEGVVQLTRLNQRIALLRAALKQQPLQTVSVLRFNPGQVRMYQLDSFSGELLHALGLSRPVAQQVHAYGVNNFSRERMVELDADILLYFTYSTRRQLSTQQYRYDFMQDPIWQQLKVVRQQRVFSVDDVIWNTASGILAAEKALDDIPVLFALNAAHLTRASLSSSTHHSVSLTRNSASELSSSCH